MGKTFVQIDKKHKIMTFNVLLINLITLVQKLYKMLFYFCTDFALLY
jgi:hypothetical protein